MEDHKNILRIAQADDLTGLPTKDQHKAQASAMLNLFHDKYKYAYVSCDIVDFKVFNETYGYAYGNVALKYTATIWSSCLRASELLSRTTRDHFCMLLRYEDKEELQHRIYAMLEMASDFPVDKEGGKHKAAFRCGVYLIQGNEEINMIRSRADMVRKSQAKSLFNSVAFYDEDSFAKELERKELETDIREAIEKRELEVFYQPKYSILTETIVGAEALIRWKHPRRGMVSPEEFIPICEENGFICDLDFYVLEEVCLQLKEWKRLGKNLLRISVNFSRVHLCDPGFVEKLVACIRHHGLETSMIEIELTESVAHHEMETLLDVMRKIKQEGFGLSMDDFGSGYSSLNLLREMPVDILKLDKGFLDDCSGDSSTREKRIIAHVISMAKDLEITVLAEGVETKQQKDFLKESRCDMIQGYYYAKPMPVEAFSAYLETVSA